ncbi:MAG: PAS domain-containing protein, partial [Magnetococcales bacterium]|nr:PAS domain-containing protein [Magnetococcales bacterium]
YTNPLWRRHSGLSAEEALGDGWQQGLHQDDRELISKNWQRMIESEGKWGLEYRFMDRQGNITWVVGTARALHDEEGKVTGFVGINTDVSDRKKAENALKKAKDELELRVIERTTELEATNKELESFAYTVSHDLRAPLRTIGSFSQILIEDYEDSLDEEGKQYLQNVVEGSQEMHDLIEGILMLSQSSKGEVRQVELNLSDTVLEIIQTHKDSQPERNVVIDVTPNILANGDPRLIHTLLENLIGNAWKYSKTTAEARIEFGVEQKDGERVFYIKDNGSGFDMKFASNLFQPFKRLHKSEDFEGTGIGLASVQKIVKRHGGWVKGEAEVGKGATFYFTLGNKKPTTILSISSKHL